MINVSEALDSDTAESILIKRKDPGLYVDGIFQSGAERTLRALASVQQPTPKDLKNLPQGERDSDLKLFICNKKLFTVSDREGTEADEVIYKGVSYKIISSADWSAYGHTTCIGARVK